MTPSWVWYGALPALPMLAAQGYYTRSRALRLPEAGGPTCGVAGAGSRELNLVLIGESPVAGVGVQSHREGLCGQTAVALARRSRARVRWHALGENGIRLRACRQRIAPRVAELRPDYIVIGLGVNDTTGLTPRRQWRRHYAALLKSLAALGPQRIVCAGVPPMASFTALPAPLRHVLGARAALLDADLAALAARHGAVHSALTRPLTSDELAPDGYHPSALGCTRWGDVLASALL